jgi:alkyl hydroperoxide reductase subunit AhpF
LPDHPADVVGFSLPKFPSLPSSVTSSKLSAVNQDNYDALVIGCGPGGSSAATFLPRPANASKTAAAAANA